MLRSRRRRLPTVTTIVHQAAPAIPLKQGFSPWFDSLLGEIRWFGGDQHIPAFTEQLTPIALRSMTETALFFGPGMTIFVDRFDQKYKAQINAMEASQHHLMRAVHNSRETANDIFRFGRCEQIHSLPATYQHIVAFEGSTYEPADKDYVENYIAALEGKLEVSGKLVLGDFFWRDKATADLPLGFEQKAWNHQIKRSSFTCLNQQNFTTEVTNILNCALAQKKEQANNISNASGALSTLSDLCQALENGDMTFQLFEYERRDVPSQLVWRDKPEEEQTLLVMLSGGLDSIFTLWDALANSKRRVIAHHIHLINQEGRNEVEAKACEEVATWLRDNCRDFELTTSLIDRRELSHFGFDMLAVGFEVGLIAATYRSRTGRLVDHWQVGHCEEEPMWPDRWNNVVNCVEATSYPYQPPVYLDQDILPKAEQLKRLPEELASLSWGCRRPLSENSEPRACGVCHTCKDRQAIGMV